MNLFSEAAAAFNNSKGFIKNHIEEKSSIEWMGVVACVSDLEPVSLIERSDGLLGLAFKYKESVTEANFSSDVFGNEFVSGSRFWGTDILFGVYDQHGKVFQTNMTSLEDLCSFLGAEGVK
jgi:hypothetical protein